jgi:hypothetical protein
MDEPEDDLTLVYMWAYKQAEKKYKGRIEQLEAALRKIACDGEPYDKCHCVNSDECSYGIARAALREKKDG